MKILTFDNYPALTRRGTFLIICTIAGCSGSSSDSSSTTVTSTLSFPFKQAYQQLVKSGVTKTFSVSAYCSGTGNITTTPAVSSGVSQYSSVTTITMSLASPSCVPTTAQTYTSNFDSNYTPVSVNNINNNNAIFTVTPVIPDTVVVGGTGIIGTETLNISGTSTAAGTIVQSYLIEPDTASTALVNIISKTYNSSGTLTLTQQDRYRITNNGDTPLTGTMTPVSSDLQYVNGLNNHLVFTYSAPSAVSASTFQLLGAYQSLVKNGTSYSFTVSGSCSGTGYLSSNAAQTMSTSTTTNPSISPSYYADTTVTISLTSASGCTPSYAQTSTAYFDSNFTQLGMYGINNSYGVFSTPLTALPTQIQVGNTGMLGTETLYAISNGSQSGALTQSYIIEPDTTTTALLNIISKTYNASNVLILTQQDKYKISPDAGDASKSVLTYKNSDLQYSYSSTTHIIYTY